MVGGVLCQCPVYDDEMCCKTSVIETMPVSVNANVGRNALDSMQGSQVFGDCGQGRQIEMLRHWRGTQSALRLKRTNNFFQAPNAVCNASPDTTSSQRRLEGTQCWIELVILPARLANALAASGPISFGFSH